ncbi:hypothetical protein AB3S75_015607 [Citrus x aurantiifolia]
MQRVVESVYKSKMGKQKSPNGNVSPLMKYLSSSSTSSSSLSSRSALSMGPFSPVPIMSKSNSSSSSSHLSAVDEEDVYVMDGLPIMSYSPSPSPSPPPPSSSSSSSKTELCRSREEVGMCRFGTKCQFAHGKEELRSTLFPTTKNKSEAQICKSFITGSCIYGSKCRFIHQVMTDSALVLTIQMEDHSMKASVCESPVTPGTFKPRVTNTAIKLEHTRKITALINKHVQSRATSTSSRDNWSPLDDGIEVTLPCHPSKTPPRVKVDEYIDSVLCCPTTAARRRLPVFTKICPEH